jgi:hypothetical protein
MAISIEGDVDYWYGRDMNETDWQLVGAAQGHDL